MKPPSTRRSRRCLSIALLGLCAGGIASAADLYRWIEADGSITFSPQRPPAGTQFELVGPDALSSGDLPRVPGDAAGADPMTGPVADPGVIRRTDPPAGSADPAAATSSSKLTAMGDSPRSDRSPAAASAGTGERTQRNLSYAPPPLGAASNGPTGITAASAGPRAEGGPDEPSRALNGTTPSTQTMPGYSMNPQRRERCRELQKRVVSLERRLGTPLSAQDMDNTVLYMARYQQNVDQHCRS